MKSLVILWREVANDFGHFCGTTTTRDGDTVSRRVEEEGDSFLGITLPTLGKGFEQALSRGRILPSDTIGFRWRRGLPVFLQGFLENVFDRTDGEVLEDPCVESIRAVRQLCYLFAKMDLDCTDDRKRKAFDQYLQCEKEMKWRRSHINRDVARLAFRQVSKCLYSRIFATIEKKVYDRTLIPNHGPGATTDRKIGNQKWNQNLWHSRLEGSFPYVDYCLPNSRFVSDCLEDVRFLEPGEEPPVKVILVPKTMKTPRVIAIESTAMQYCQQAIRKELYEAIENDRLIGSFIGLTDQTPNQRMACEGSLFGELATLDLSEASDRVSIEHVEDLLDQFPILREAVFSCRSTTADVNGEVISLSKFASMGSALTFPLEAMVFFTIIVMAELVRANFTIYDIARLPRQDAIIAACKRLKRKSRVYGDDIIVPVGVVPSVTELMTDFGFVINSSKSFWTGKFRESCGKEYYDGQDVSVLKYRLDSIPVRMDVVRASRLADFRNLCYQHGYWKTVCLLDEHLAKVLVYYPTISSTSQAVGRHSFLGYENSQRWDKEIQVPLVKGHSVIPRIPPRRVSDAAALLKCLIVKTDDDFHLERSGRPSSVYTKTGWFRAY